MTGPRVGGIIERVRRRAVESEMSLSALVAEALSGYLHDTTGKET